jgi:hypothetical protein
MINLEESEKIVKPKRGRKSKKELAALANNNDTNKTILKDSAEMNIAIEEKEVLNEQCTSILDFIEDANIIVKTSTEDNKPPAKKRGRKPKGGKIIQQVVPVNVFKEETPNVILHLKCSLKDLHSQNIFSNNLEPFHFSNNKNELNYNLLESDPHNNISNFNSENQKIHLDNKATNICFEESENYDSEFEKEVESKQVWKKLKNLEHNLHSNNIGDKKSACFWCTYEFDNPPIYIPKHYIKGSYQVYGCFCSPECSVAFLMEENIDSSTKFERYHLLNHIYAKVYNYNKNIKPAPNPYYMLNKYYGNLSIQEYRSLLRNERFFLIVDKPLTRILPELHEDNEDHIINNKIIPTNSFQVKKKIQKKQQTKSAILSEKFGMQINL